MSYLVKKTSTDGFRVRFFDYDGTILSTQYISLGGEAQAPIAPTHDRLTFLSWNNSFSDIQHDLDVGALYGTLSGNTELDVTVTAVTGLSITLYLSKSSNSLMTVSWGDTSSSTSSAYTAVSFTHTYSVAGNYTISINDSTEYFLGQGTSGTPIVDNNSQLINAYIGTLGPCNLSAYAFYECCSLLEISMTNSITKSGNYVFFSCKSLDTIIFPSTFSSIGAYEFQVDYMLTNVILPASMNSIGTSAFQNCLSLKSILATGGAISANAFYSCSAIEKIFILSTTAIPNLCFNSNLCLRSFVVDASLISIGDSAFNSCLSLTYLSFPSTLKSIAALAFNACTEMTEYHFKSTTPPTLASTNAFTGINQICKIYVPTASVAAYKAAANWSTYSNYIFGE